MPDITGRLYPSERDALKPKVEPKPKGQAKAKAVPVPVVKASKPVHPMRLAVGRPGRFVVTPEAVQRVLDAIATGVHKETALISEGLSRQAVERWFKVNPALAQRFAEAEAKWEVVQIARINKAGDGDWKATSWILERRSKDRWSPPGKLELTGKDGGAVAVLSVQKALFSNVSAAGDNRQRIRQAKERDAIPV